MNFNIDTAIFIGFLVINLVVGLFYSRGVTTIKEYAVGERNFSTGTLAATVIATCVGGGFFSGAIAESYRQGLYFIIPAMGEPLALIVIGYFLAPRMGEFLGSLSIAEALGNIYGKWVRIITAIASIFLCAGITALQFKVAANIFELFFGFSGLYAVLTSAVIVIFYSSLGGIRAVTFTDIIQFFTFGTIIPILTLVIWGTLSDPQKVLSTITHNPLFDLNLVFDIYNLKFVNSLFLLLFFLIPSFQPVFFQRAMMAKDTVQISNAFNIAGAICLALLLVTVWVGVLILSDNPTLEPNNLLSYIILNYGYSGLKGLTAIGIMSIIMSTADSYINSAAVLFSNDIIKPLNVKRLAGINELSRTRIFAVILGCIAFFLAFKASTILKLIILILGFYTPIVTGPMLLAIFGFRSSPRVVMIGITAGISTVILFEIFKINAVDAVIPGLVLNISCCLISHYFLKEPGGWVGIQDPTPLITIRLARKRKIQHFIKSLINFNLWKSLRNNVPIYDYVYSLCGLFCIVSVFSTMYSIPKNIQLEHSQILEFIYHTVLISSSILITFPVWPQILKQEKFIVIAWNIMLPYILIFAPTMLIIISNFGQFQLMIFLLNILIIASMLRWQVAILMICCTVFLSIQTYKWYMGVENLRSAVDVGLQFKIMYALLLSSTILFIFLKPKQDYLEATEIKVEELENETENLAHEVTDLNGQVIGLNNQVVGLNHKLIDLNDQVTHYSERVATQDKEIERLGAAGQKILNNVNHELRLPIGNVINFSEMMQETLKKTENNKLLKELVKEVYDNSNRVSSMILNMLDLATLEVKKVDLQKTKINFSELVNDRVKQCQRIYLRDKNIKFKIDIEPEVMVSVDPNYIRQTVDNLVINSINFSNDGLITVSVKKDERKVIFIITDEGIGIPKEELYDIFTPFKMGSNIESKAQGRGVGLALCKSAVEAHGGSITADSNGENGAKFTFKLPYIEF